MTYRFTFKLTNQDKETVTVIAPTVDEAREKIKKLLGIAVLYATLISVEEIYGS